MEDRAGASVGTSGGIVIRVIAAASLWLSLIAAPLDAQRTDDDPRSLDEAVGDMLRETITPGAVIAIVIRDSVALVKAYGSTSMDASAPPLAEDAFACSRMAASQRSSTIASHFRSA